MIKDIVYSILHETPDYFIHNRKQKIDWMMKGVSFGFLNNFLFYSNKNIIETHGQLLKPIYLYIFSDQQEGVNEFQVYPSLKEKDIIELKKIKFKGSPRDIMSPAGRLWEKYKTISFWNIKNVEKHHLDSLIHVFNMDKNLWKIEINRDEFVTINDFLNKNYEKTYSDEEVQKLMAIQHVSPQKLSKQERDLVSKYKIPGSEAIAQRAEKYGFSTPAEFKYWLSKTRER